MTSFTEYGTSLFPPSSTQEDSDSEDSNSVVLPEIHEGKTNKRAEASNFEQELQSGPLIGVLTADYARTDLDYEIFRLENLSIAYSNKVTLPSTIKHPSIIHPKTIARKSTTKAVWAVTGTSGCVQGEMTQQPHYIKMEGSQTLQEMWAVELERKTSENCIFTELQRKS